MRHRTCRSINQLLLWTMFVTTMGIFYWQFFSEPFLKCYGLPWEIQAEVLHPGEKIPMVVKRCNSQDEIRAYTNTQQLLNLDTGEVLILPDTYSAIVPGCTTVVASAMVVPDKLPPGRYRVQGMAKINDFAAVRLVKWYSKPFTVENP